MSKVITYKNDKVRSFCQIKLDNKERILISIASVPKPSVRISKLALGGLVPVKTIWEFNPTMAGGYNSYIKKLMNMFLEPEQDEMINPLDAIKNKSLPCKSINEVLHSILEFEKGDKKLVKDSMNFLLYKYRKAI
jgi:hypothetical protein